MRPVILFKLAQSQQSRTYRDRNVAALHSTYMPQRSTGRYNREKREVNTKARSYVGREIQLNAVVRRENKKNRGFVK